MSKKNADAPSQEQVLAAIERAVRQSKRPVDGVIAAMIADHLALSPRSGAWRVARGHLRVLEGARDVERFRRNGLAVWGVTRAGRRRLAGMRRGGEYPVLPESPQHRVWRDSRRLTKQEMGRFREELSAALDEGTQLLRLSSVSSAAWLDCSRRLSRAAGTLASAVHCLDEWPEPDESGPDVAPVVGLRNLARWQDSL
jgi:hypothetical protein